jgi:hypothetical protein
MSSSKIRFNNSREKHFYEEGMAIVRKKLDLAPAKKTHDFEAGKNPHRRGDAKRFFEAGVRAGENSVGLEMDESTVKDTWRRELMNPAWAEGFHAARKHATLAVRKAQRM